MPGDVARLLVSVSNSLAGELAGECAQSENRPTQQRQGWTPIRHGIHRGRGVKDERRTALAQVYVPSPGGIRIARHHRHSLAADVPFVVAAVKGRRDCRGIKAVNRGTDVECPQGCDGSNRRIEGESVKRDRLKKRHTGISSASGCSEWVCHRKRGRGRQIETVD